MTSNLEETIQKIVDNPTPQLIRGYMGEFHKRYTIGSLMIELWYRLDEKKSLELDLFGHKTFRYFLRLSGNFFLYPKVYLTESLIDLWIDGYVSEGTYLKNHYRDIMTDKHIFKIIDRNAWFINEIPMSRITNDMLNFAIIKIMKKDERFYRIFEYLNLRSDQYEYIMRNKLMNEKALGRLFNNPNWDSLNKSIFILGE